MQATQHTNLHPAPASVAVPQPARQLRRLALLLSTLLLGFVVLFGWLSWRSEKADQILAMQTVLELGEKALDQYFVQMDAGLQALALELGAQGGLADLQQAQHLLQRYNRLHPETVSVNLLRLDGQVLVSSVGRRPGGGADGNPHGGLPTLAQAPSYRVFLAELRPDTQLDLGRPLAGALSQQWVFPMRQVLRGDQGQPAAVLAVGIPVALLQSFWRDVPAFGKASIGLIRDDGYLLSRYPSPPNPDAASLYGVPRQGALRQHLVANGYPARGYVEGINQITGLLHGNVFMRLQHYPVTLFVSLPAAEFVAAWWQRVRVPILLVGLLGGVGMFGYGHMLRSQQAWANERRQADAVLRASEQEQRFLLDHLLAGVIVHGPCGAVLRCNPQAALLMGLTEAQMLGQVTIDPAWRFMREDGSTMPRSDYPVFQVLRTGAPVRGVVLGVVQPGRAQPVWLLGDAYPEFVIEHATDHGTAQTHVRSAEIAPSAGAAAAIHRVVVTFVDISGRRQVEQTLAQSERRYRLLFENSLDGVLQTRPDGSILSANPAACSIFGMDEAALRARGRNGLVDPADPRVAVLLAQRVRDGRTSGEITMLRGDGSPFEAEVSSVLYTDDTGQPLSSLLLRDVTNRRQAEAALAAKDAAEQANHAKTAFMARMSHELRTPLNAILGFSQVLVDDASPPLTALQQQRVQHIQHAGDHLLSLINDLLDLSRIESGALQRATGQGTDFVLHGLSAAPTTSVITPATTPVAALATGHVLYIDDDSVNRLLMQAFLDNWPGLQLSLAADGASGLALARQAVPDLVLIDMMMPVMDGLQVLQALRSNPLLCAIPCVAVSANAMPQEIDDALAAGFDGYLTKPLLAAALLAEIDRALRVRRPLATGAQTNPI